MEVVCSSDKGSCMYELVETDNGEELVGITCLVKDRSDTRRDKVNKGMC